MRLLAHLMEDVSGADEVSGDCAKSVGKNLDESATGSRSESHSASDIRWLIK